MALATKACDTLMIFGGCDGGGSGCHTATPWRWQPDFGTERGIDGMTVASDGIIVATAGTKAAAGIYFFSPQGKKLGFLPTPEDPSNCCFGGSDRKTLYVTAGKSLYRVLLTVG